MMRLRMLFAKTPAMRFTGHLDLHRAWERTFRRSGLPLAYSQGFNPQPRLSLACALPLGFTSEAEVLDSWLETDCDPLEARMTLQTAAPPGIQILYAEAAELRSPALQTQTVSSEYRLTLPAALPDLDARLQAVLGADSLPRERRGKPYDLRPLILELRLDGADGCLFACLAARESATGRPEELIFALGLTPETVRVHRTRLNFTQPAFTLT